MNDDQKEPTTNRGLSNPSIRLIAGCVFFLVLLLLNQKYSPQTNREELLVLSLSTLLSILAGVPILALLSLLGMLDERHSWRSIMPNFVLSHGSVARTNGLFLSRQHSKRLPMSFKLEKMHASLSGVKLPPSASHRSC